MTDRTVDRLNGITPSALDLIGNTPLIALDRLWKGPGRLLAKCEFLNPTGSLKDRSSLFMITKARESGKLNDGDPVIEVTSGNQGGGIACVTAVLGHPFTVAMSKGNSPQRAIMMKALGANCILTDQVNGKPGNVTADDVAAAEEAAMKVKDEIGAYYVDQFNNQTNWLAHYEMTGPEIWRQTAGKIDAFLIGCGTGGCFVGTSKFLKEKNSNIKCFVVEPEGCQPIEGCTITKPLHLLQGSGYGCVPTLFKPELYDGTMAVSDEDAVKYRKLLGQKEGLYCGYTTGANIAAAIKLLQSGKLPKDAVVVTILCDSGLKYPE
ncbi:uncharacterized protein LOC128388040 [Panonychus citri]|uniref:uncharacterized protein LOC128388040 n=1 Tax=Panonychus citri TaxID=50023 RepID=UPI0023072A11|nr:uncharacterized protein LOC128388040 [Panonychus citri]